MSTGIDLITNDSLRIKISSLYSDGYSELILFDKVVQNFNDNQYSPIVFNLIKFNDYTLSQNNFNELKYSIPISNSIKSLHRKRVLLLDRVKIVKKDAEILIGDIHKELERLGGEILNCSSGRKYIVSNQSLESSFSSLQRWIFLCIY